MNRVVKKFFRDKRKMSNPANHNDKIPDEMEEFVSSAAHDLRAPLRAVENLARWIEDDLGSSPKPELLENFVLIHSRLRRMNRLLDDYLIFSRVGRDEGSPETFNLDNLAREVVKIVEPRTGIIVEIQDRLPTVEASVAPIKQILIQLVSNALRHHDKAQGRVWIGANDLAKEFEILVKDDGPGIDPRNHERIFQLGQTLRSKDEIEGSGVGLALVRKIINRHHASIHLESSLGQGSLFKLTWPKGT
jgi:signal transduction histidine kinase